MRRFRFLLSREWLGYFAFLLVFAIVCIGLSNWQFARKDEAARQNAAIAANWNADPSPLLSVVAADGTVDDGTRYRPVSLRGEYIASAILYARNRTENGQAGFEQLVPFRDQESGLTVIVSRGWIPTADQGALPDSLPAPPAGTVSLVARLASPEQSLGRQSPPGQVASIALGDIRTALGSVLGSDRLFVGGYGKAVSEQPPGSGSLTAESEPSFDEGLHLSYALQWIAFAVLGAVGFVYALRTTLRHQHEDAEAAGPAWGGGPGGPPRSRYGHAGDGWPRRDRDAEVEDAILDGAAGTTTDSR